MKGDVKKASMLFDHRIDGKENKNRVDEKKYKNKVESLSSFIRIKKSSFKGNNMKTVLLQSSRLVSVVLFMLYGMSMFAQRQDILLNNDWNFRFSHSGTEGNER